VLLFAGLCAAFAALAPMLVPGSAGAMCHPWPAAAIMKDLFVIWIFAWAIALNTYNAVAGLEHLANRRQFVTARKCLNWDSSLEARMPIRCVHFPWNWGVVCIALVAGFLIVLELNYYGQLDPGPEAVSWHMLLGIARQLLFVVAIAEVMLFYKKAVAEVRAEIT